MASFLQALGNKAGFFRAFGHSYIENQLGTADQTGRPDGIFRDIMSILFNEWQNWAVTGSVLMEQGVSQGGYARMLQAIPGAIRGAPYVSNGGATLLCWGINDLGKNGPGATYLSAYIDAMRCCISRARMSSIKENTDASIAYGAGFTLASNSSEFTSGVSYRTSSVITNSNFTITLPADYDGSPVVLCFIGIFNGGSGTFSGTAGVTGTFNTSGIIPTAEVSHCPRIKRITNLTSAAAGLTIIFTANSYDSTGTIDFDCWWIEAANPPPVIVCDLVKLNALGYSGFAAISANSVAVNDAFVDQWNDALYRLVAEFDSMVQIAYHDDAISKNAALLWSVDGVHPNEFGSAVLADSMVDACRRLEVPPGGKFSPASYINSPAPRGGQIVRIHRPATWYTAEYDDIGATYTMVSGDLFCLPFQVTSPRLRIVQFACEVTTAMSTTAGTIRWGICDDPSQSGYPFGLMHELTSGGAFSLGTTTGVKTSPLSPTAGFIDKPIDAGVFWLVMKITAIGSPTGVLRTLAGKNLQMPNTSTTGLPLLTNAGYMGYKLTGQGTTALTSAFPAAGVLTAAIPYIGFKTQ